MSDRKIATDKQADEIQGLANEWYKTQGVRWASASYTAKAAVAEFIANSCGLTLYEERK